MGGQFNKLAELVRTTSKDTPQGPFRPFADYNDRLDIVIVLTKDCSFMEIPQREGLCILVNNYPESAEQPEPVGLVIYNAKEFCQLHKLAFDGRLSLSRLLWFVSHWLPDIRTMRKIGDVFSEDILLEISPNATGS